MIFSFIKNNKIHVPKLEFDVTEHCNLRCNNCNHSSPFMPPRFADIDDFEKDINKLSEVYHAKTLILMGGEPLLNKNIIDFVSIAKKNKIADQIYISTNGVLLHKLKDELIKEIDALYVNLYPNTSCNNKKIAFAKNICKNNKTKFLIYKTYKFVKCFVDYLIKDNDLVNTIYKTCDTHFFHCHTIYRGRYYKCHHCMYLNSYLNKRNVEAPNFIKTDGIPLHESDLFNRILEYKNKFKQSFFFFTWIFR